MTRQPVQIRTTEKYRYIFAYLCFRKSLITLIIITMKVTWRIKCTVKKNTQKYIDNNDKIKPMIVLTWCLLLINVFLNLKFYELNSKLVVYLWIVSFVSFWSLCFPFRRCLKDCSSFTVYCFHLHQLVCTLSS